MSIHHRFLINAISIALMQGANLLIPILILPILTRALGAEGYGTIGFVSAVIAYFVLLCDWGFNLSSTQQVAIHKDSIVKRSSLFWETIICRCFLAIIGLVALEMFLFFRVSDLDSNLFRLSYLAVFATAISPAFFYQGIEKMGVVAVINSLVKLLAVPLCYYYVHAYDDLYLAIAIPASCNLLANLFNFICLVMGKSIQFTNPHFSDLKEALKTGYPIFLSTASISLYTNTNVVVLGLLASPSAVGYFVSGQVLIKAAQGLYQPFSQALFPKSSRNFHHLPELAVQNFRILLRIQCLVSVVLTLLVMWMLPLIVRYMLAESFLDAISVFYWLTPVIFFIGISNVLGVHAMIPLGYHSQFSKILLISGLLNIVVILPMSYYYASDGAAIAVLITESFVTFAMGAVLFVKKPQLFFAKN